MSPMADGRVGSPGSGRVLLDEHSLVGRDDLIDELIGAGRAAAAGTGAVVLLTGAAGMGKTSIARAVARALRDDLEVTWGNCAADRSAPPFWPWRNLVTFAVPEPAHDAELPGARRFELLGELHGQLVTRSRERPVLHVIEDLQWADVASVLLLVQAATSIADTPLMVVATVRTGEDPGAQLQAAIEEVSRLAVVRDLPPLDDAAVATLMRDTRLQPEPEMVALVRDRSGGNPLFATELLRAVDATAPAASLRSVVRAAVPARVSELMVTRLTRLPDAVADLVRTAAVVGTEGDVRTLASIRRSSAESVLALLEQARAAQLMDAAEPGRWVFRHDLVRDAVYAGVPDTDRAREHAAIVEVLAADNTTPPSVLARHALAAQPIFDGERAVAMAERAGEHALERHAYEEAAGWFRQAFDASPRVDTSPRWNAELLVRCGEACRQAGEIEAARRDFVAAAELSDDPGLLVRAALGFADPGADLGIAYRSDDPTTATLLDRAITAQPPEDAAATVYLEARLAAELYFADQPGRARELAESATERARRLGDERALGAAAAVTHDAFVVGQASLDDQLAGSDRLLAWARSTGTAAARLTAHRARVLDLLAAGDTAGMDAAILAFRRVADPLRVPAYQWWPSLWSAMRALLEGRQAQAETQALEAFKIGKRPFPSLAMANLSFLLFFLRREQGRLDEMEDATRQYAASHADIPALRVALAFLLAETGRTDEARGMMTAIDETELGRLHDRNWPASWFQLARTAAITGKADMAETLLGDRHRPTERCVTVSLATVCLGATDLAVAWLLHASGDLDAAAERYAAAAALNGRIGARAWLAQTRADHARLLLDRGRPGDLEQARSLLDLAAGAAEDIGLVSIRPLLDGLGHRLDAAAGAATEGPAPPRWRSTFRRTGPVWQIEFAGRSVQLPHARGLTDIAFLLSRPDREVSVLDLVQPDGTAAAAVRGAPAYDERARREIRDRLRELDEEIDAAEDLHDAGRAEVAREQRQVLAETVARDLGLGGRSRLIGDPTERARKTVSTRIRRSIATVGRTHPELGRHLERSIDTGAWCAYRPADPVDWIT